MYSEIAKNPVEIQQIYSSKRQDIQQIYSRGSAPGGIGEAVKMCAEKMPRADTGRRRQRVPGSGRGAAAACAGKRSRGRRRRVPGSGRGAAAACAGKRSRGGGVCREAVAGRRRVPGSSRGAAGTCAGEWLRNGGRSWTAAGMCAGERLRGGGGDWTAAGTRAEGEARMMEGERDRQRVR